MNQKRTSIQKLNETKPHQFIFSSMVRSHRTLKLGCPIKLFTSPSSDPENLIVENHEHNMIIGLQYEPFVIPCKPTSPNVKVELIREDGEVNIISFNHTSGFLAVGNDPVEGGLMACEFSRNDKTQELHFIFEIDPGDLTTIFSPMIISPINFVVKSFNPKNIYSKIPGPSKTCNFRFTIEELLLKSPLSRTPWQSDLIPKRMCLKLIERCKLKLVYKFYKNTLEYYAIYQFMTVYNQIYPRHAYSARSIHKSEKCKFLTFRSPTFLFPMINRYRFKAAMIPKSGSPSVSHTWQMTVATTNVAYKTITISTFNFTWS